MVVLHVPGLTTSITADAASNWDDQWSAGYLTTRSNFLPHRQIRKVSLTESAGGVVGGAGEGVCKQFLSKNGKSRLLIVWTL